MDLYRPYLGHSCGMSISLNMIYIFSKKKVCIWNSDFFPSFHLMLKNLIMEYLLFNLIISEIRFWIILACFSFILKHRPHSKKIILKM